MGAIPAPNNRDPAPLPSGNFPLLPLGWYRGQILAADIKPLGTGNGTGLFLEVALLSPGYVNRKMWATINVNHTNQQTEAIGQKQLDELYEATGFTRQTLQDSLQFVGREMLLKLKIQPAKNGYPAKNQISGFAKVGTNKQLVPPPAGSGGTASTPWSGNQQQAASQPAQSAQAPAATPAPAAAGRSNTPPWQR